MGHCDTSNTEAVTNSAEWGARHRFNTMLAATGCISMETHDTNSKAVYTKGQPG